MTLIVAPHDPQVAPHDPLAVIIHAPLMTLITLITLMFLITLITLITLTTLITRSGPEHVPTIIGKKWCGWHGVRAQIQRVRVRESERESHKRTLHRLDWRAFVPI